MTQFELEWPQTTQMDEKWWRRHGGYNLPRRTEHEHAVEGENFAKIAEVVRERDGHECRRCGVAQEELFKGQTPALTPRKLDVHHVIPRREFDEPSAANSKDNLVAVCRPCHWELEGKPAAIQRGVL